MSSGSTGRSRPVVFLAFANEQAGRHYLRDLPEEQRRLRAIVQEAVERGLCELEVRPNATLDEIDQVFTHHGRRVAIFHHAGHAGPEGLLLESSSGEGRLAHAEGLVRFFGRQEGLQLVVLNGCSTRPQLAELLESGVPSIVATARPIVDEVAREFAVAFYTQLAAGRNLRDAFELARERVKAGRGTNPRDLVAAAAFAAEEVADDRGFPWDLRTRPGAERAERLSLPELAGDPLFGLPELKKGQWLPPSPYRHLQRFTRNEAAVFFGRGNAIRSLYDLATSPSSRPVILYSGPTGVGKSSVLDAGLTPRLEATHEVVYLRRDADSGLLGTLRRGLSCDPDVRTSDLNHLWLEREKTTGRPLVVVLDQAEEVFTRPWGPSPAQEVAELVGAVRGLFADPARAPRGKLILGFRKEWLQEFERAHDDVQLGYERMLLAPLDRAGIVEAIEGPTRHEDLRRHYGLTVEPGLAETIAVDLEADAGSALAPTLQVLLTKLWEAAGNKGAAFTHALYDRLKDQGFLLKDVLDEGLKSLKAWRTDVVESGFALDLLEYHTTPFGTAETHAHTQLVDRYPHRTDVLDECLRICEKSYLLIPAETKVETVAPVPEPSPEPNHRESPPTRLGHDTLAPLVREQFRTSMAPAQRARRLLENRAGEWKGKDSGPVLDRIDLEAVEQGRPWMRGLQDDEPRLLEASRQAEARRQAEEEERRRQIQEAQEKERKAEARTRRTRGIAAVGLGCLSLILAGATIWAWRAQRSATANAEKANRKTAEVLTTGGVTDLEQEHSFDAMHLFAQAIAAVPRNSPDRANNRLRLGVLEQQVPHLRAILEGHRGEVNSAAFSPDGARVVTASMDRTARVWEAASGRLIAELKGHGRGVWSAAFSPDGARVVTASGDKTARVWEAATGRLVAELKGHGGWVKSAAFSPDGARVVTASADKTARVWEAASGRLVTELKGHTNGVDSAAFSPEGTRVVTASADKTARVWEAASGRLVAELKGHGGADELAQRAYEALGGLGGLGELGELGTKLKGYSGAVHSAAFSPDGARVVTASSDNTARVWEAASGRLVAELKGHGGPVFSAAFSPDGGLVVAASSDKTARVWAASGPLFAELKGHRGMVNSAVFSPHWARVVTASDDRTARVWVVAPMNGRLIAELKGHRGEVNSAVFSPDGARVVTASADKTARVWEAASGPLFAELKGHRGPVNSAASSPDGARVVTASEDTTARVWEAASGRVVAELKGHRGPVNSAAFSPDGARVVTASDDRTARVWEAASGRLFAELKGHLAPVKSAAFSPDGARVVTASADTTVRVWEAASGRVVAELKGHRGPVWSAAFSPDGARVVTVPSDSTVQVWEAASGQMVAKLKAPGGSVRSAAFSPDGARVVTPSWGDPISRVWEAATGWVVAELKGHGDGVMFAGFSPDGARVVTASLDCTARVWEAATGRVVAELKGHLAPVKSAAFSPDGARVVTASADRTARVWRLDSLPGEAETLPLWVEVFTGTELQVGGVRPLSAAEWQTRRQKLLDYGSKAPPTPWLLDNDRNP